MPPKGSKRKVATPEPEAAPSPKKAGSPRKANNAPKKPGRPKSSSFAALNHSPGTLMPINVSYEGPTLEAKQAKGGTYSHALKLEASSAFRLMESIVLQDGPHEGRQAIIIMPAKSFPFTKLPENVRQSIYQYYFAQNGIIGEPISFDGKRPSSKELYAKTYAARSKYRVGLLTVNKEINAEAFPYLFAVGFRFENTGTLVDFISQISSDKRQLITSISVKQYLQKSARNALHLLAEAKNLQRLHFERGVFTHEPDPSKAAKQFHYDAYKFLDAMGTFRGDKLAGVDIVSFGRLAFTYKSGEKCLPWLSADVEKFKEELRKKQE